MLRNSCRLSCLADFSAAGVLGAGAAVAAAVLAILGLVEAPSWSLLVATIVVGGITSFVAFEKLLNDSRAKKQAREHKWREEETAAAKWVRAVQECLIWPLPGLDEIDPIRDMGVARSELAEQSAGVGGSLAPYVERDIDRIARERLRSQGAVLLIGAPLSGVTRTAYQLALSTPRRILIPKAPEALTIALRDLDVLSAVPPTTPLLLWLDRIDTFTEAGLTAAMLARCQEHAQGFRIVATISSLEYNTWVANNPSFAEVFGRHVGTLSRKLSSEEFERAECAYPGIDFGEGIGAAFTLAATLLKRMHGGNGNCAFEHAGDDCAVARVIVDIVLDWDRTDIGVPLPFRQLSVLVEQRLGGDEPTEAAHLASALTWATSKGIGGASPLVLAGVKDGLQAFNANPALVQIRRDEWPSPADDVMTAAIEEAVGTGNSEALGRIGYRAHIEGNVSAAERVWARIAAIGDPAVDWLSRAAAYSRTRGEAVDEIPPLSRKLVLAESAYGPDHPAVVGLLNDLGNAWVNLGQPAKARDLFERALSSKQRRFGSDHREVAGSLNSLGAAWLALDQPAEAHDLLERALRIYEREFGPDHREVATVLTNLGGVRLKLGQPAEARNLFERAVFILEREFGPDHPDVAKVLTNLGAACGELGRPTEARDLLERALPVLERRFGPNHPEVGRILANLGAEWSELGEPARARDLLERALRIKERSFGPDHPEVAGILTSLGAVRLRLGQPTRAHDLLERALRIRSRNSGSDNPEVATILFNLGAVLLAQGQPTRARDLLERALRIREAQYGPNHPEVGYTLSNLAMSWGDAGQPDKARELYQRALRIFQSYFPDGHPLIKRIAHDLRAVDPDVILLNDGRLIGRTDAPGDSNL